MYYNLPNSAFEADFLSASNPEFRINPETFTSYLNELTAATGRRISTNRLAKACLISLSFTSRK